MWQDPLFGYFESHGKSEFKPGEQYDLTPKEQQAVLERNRIKELLKLEFIKREYDPINRKYCSGKIVDPAMFRWYAASMTSVETFRMNPKTVLGAFVAVMGAMILYVKYTENVRAAYTQDCRDGKYLWWDRTGETARWTRGGHGLSMVPNCYD